MSDINLRSITNSFQDVRLASMASWRQAAEFTPRDKGGPYVVMQEGYDPQDPKFIADEFVLGRSGKWLSLSYFYQMPVSERVETALMNALNHPMADSPITGLSSVQQKLDDPSRPAIQYSNSNRFYNRFQAAKKKA